MCKKLKRLACNILDQKFDGISSPNYSHGKHAAFIPINNRIAVKIYQNEDIAREAFQRQSDAYDICVAPAIYCFFAYNHYWCLVTEIAYQPYTWYRDYADYEVDDPDFGRAEDFDNWLYDNFSEEEFNELLAKLRSIGFNFDDYAAFNLGEINGRLVCIDFGPVML